MSELQRTLITDLDVDLIENPPTITKTIKNEINRSMKEGVEVKLFDSKQLKSSPEIIKEYAEMYHEMYKQKGIKAVLSFKDINALIDSEAYMMTVAYVNGKASVYHTYVVDGENARLSTSCSDFRVQDKQIKNAIGRANKYLHWKDFELLQQRGVKVYDWGGISDFDNPNGIDVFKMSFGGERQEYYNIIVYNTFKSKLLRGIKRLIGRG